MHAVIPANAGIQAFACYVLETPWIPASGNNGLYDLSPTHTRRTGWNLDSRFRE